MLLEGSVFVHKEEKAANPAISAFTTARKDCLRRGHMSSSGTRKYLRKL